MIRYILLLLLSLPSYGQSTFIKGLVKNEKTNTGIPHVHIYSATNPLNGSVSNVDGQFAINLLKTNELVFSHIGYAPKMVDINEENTNTIEVKLTPMTIELSEVSVSAKGITGQDVINKVIEDLKANHKVEPIIYDFHSTLVNFDQKDSTVHLLEEYHGAIYQKLGIFNISSSRYHIEKCRIGAFSEIGEKKINEHRIISADKMKSDNIFKYTEDYLRKGKSTAYTYTINDRTIINNRPCYVIKFNTNKRTAYKSGKLYIDMDDYAIVRKTLENSNGEISHRIDFRKNNVKGKWYLVSAMDYHPLYKEPSADLRYTIYYLSNTEYDLSSFKTWSPRDFVIDYANDFKDEFWEKTSFIPLPSWIREQLETGR